MLEYSKIEAERRNNYISHHFEVEHLSSQIRDQIGFLGEFAFCTLLNIDWKENIRDNYLTIDDCDLVINEKKIDVKTETIPLNSADKILRNSIKDNDLYGCRLINEGQVPLLSKYDIVFFGMFIRGHLDYWYPIGYMYTKKILQNYNVTKIRPDGGIYPFPAIAVPTSELLKLKTKK